MQTSTITLDLDKLRQETPGCKNIIHFNNAGASLMPKPVTDAVIAHINLESQIGGYEALEKEQEKIERVYSSIAKFINSKKEEIAIIENATRAWDMAFYSIPLKEGNEILTSVSEYASNYLAFMQIAKKTGAVIKVVPNDEHGQTSIDALKKSISKNTKLIAITHVPTNGGLVNQAKEIGRVAKDANILFLLDACQSIGQMPINVNEIHCDILSATSRKYLRGPRGVGFLYVRKDIIKNLEPVFLDLHSADWISKDKYKIRDDAKRFENWECNVAGKLGLGAAIDYALSLGIENIWERVSSLGKVLRERLNAINGVVVRDLGETKCGIVSFTIEGKDPEVTKQKLLKQRVNVSTSTQSGTLIDMEERKLESLIRASVHYYNTEDEIDRFCKMLKEILA